MTFTIYIQEKSTRYKMQVECTQYNDWTEHYKVTGGNKEIVFKNNRPEVKRLKRAQRYKWQLVSKNFTTGDIQKASELMIRIQDAIEGHIDRQPTFQYMRNKN